ncbi:hypothetical protein BDU57DRAFT_444394 [Ampelomyces quisqualis]|uniref:OTU domain-containing protein n=1 Tax=Ampelomyces quisqualis TaxID=50730 RepID=A0A6A5QT85_AMPQU|nr:hypothetical protein BDU57DRAFT_444394 [Ampelomyces quisqualis]
MNHAETQPETLAALQARHRKEQRDLVSRITQKKKQASKKARKGVKDECERLERELQERQENEVAMLEGGAEDAEELAEAMPSDEEEAQEEEAEEEEEEALEAGVAKLHINGTDMNAAPAGKDKKKKPNRAKARLARRAAEQDAAIRQAELEAANAPNPRELERERMEAQLEKHGLALHEISANGHCLYAAVADQLHSRELATTSKILSAMADNEVPKRDDYRSVRNAAADWIEAHADDFAGFIEDPLPEHVRKIRDTGEWGGHVELLALARTYRIRICVLHSHGSVDRIEPEGENSQSSDIEDIWLGYYKHSHGLGEHYNSLRKQE